MGNEIKYITKKTLLPIGVVVGLLIGAVGVGSWVAGVNNGIEQNKLKITENKIFIEGIADDVKGYDERMARVETKIDLLLEKLNIE